MTISSSLNASVAGLAANATRLATISDNIANSATYGYKRAVADFHSMVVDAGNGRYSAGGVRVTTTRMIDSRGPLVSTSNATDIAVRGRGLLPVTSDVERVDNTSTLMLTTTGSFRPDANGYLRTASGMMLMGWPADPGGNIPTFARDTFEGLEPIQINANQFPGEPTTEMKIAINLPSTETEAGMPGSTQALSLEYFDNLGKSSVIAMEFTPVVPATGSSNQWRMILRDSESGNAVVGDYLLTFDDARGTGGMLLSVSNFVGDAYDPATGNLRVNVAGGPIDVNIGVPGDSDGITQLSDNFSPVTISKNGSPVGNTTSIEIDSDGFVYAYYDIGVTRKIYQVPLVDVQNVNGLITLDEQTYAPSPQSGTFFLWDAGTGPTGDIVSYALEESTTDVAQELTTLIQTQRAYSSNAKVIQTVDEMLQETTNIKR